MSTPALLGLESLVLLLRNVLLWSDPDENTHSNWHQPCRTHPKFTMASPSESPPAADGSLIPTDKVGELRTHRDISKVKRLSTVVVDRLSRSVGGTVPPASSSSSQGRRVFSLNRKNKQLSIGRCQPPDTYWWVIFGSSLSFRFNSSSDQVYEHGRGIANRGIPVHSSTISSNTASSTALLR